MSETFLSGVEGIEIIEKISSKKKDKEVYSDEFVKKIKSAEEDIKKGNTTKLNPNDIWGSIL